MARWLFLVHLYPPLVRRRYSCGLPPTSRRTTHCSERVCRLRFSNRILTFLIDKVCYGRGECGCCDVSKMDVGDREPVSEASCGVSLCPCDEVLWFSVVSQASPINSQGVLVCDESVFVVEGDFVVSCSLWHCVPVSSSATVCLVRHPKGSRGSCKSLLPMRYDHQGRLPSRGMIPSQ